MGPILRNDIQASTCKITIDLRNGKEPLVIYTSDTCIVEQQHMLPRKDLSPTSFQVGLAYLVIHGFIVPKADAENWCREDVAENKIVESDISHKVQS